MNMLILTGWDSGFDEVAGLCIRSKMEWAERYGIPLRILRDADYPPEHGHPSFQKLRHIRKALEEFGAVFWMDADSIITNPNFDPAASAKFEAQIGSHLLVSADYPAPEDDRRPSYNRWSAGHMLWIRDYAGKSFALLEDAIRHDSSKWGGLWDQDALQWACDWNPTLRPRIIPERSMNSVVPGLTGNPKKDWKPGDFLCHFTGVRREERPAVIRNFIAQHVK